MSLHTRSQVQPNELNGKCVLCKPRLHPDPRHTILLGRSSPYGSAHSPLTPSTPSNEEARRRPLSRGDEQRRLGSSCVRGACVAVVGGASGSCSIRASVSDCTQLSLDGMRNSLRGTSSPPSLGWQRNTGSVSLAPPTDINTVCCI